MVKNKRYIKKSRNWRKGRNSNVWSNGADSIMLMSNNSVAIYPFSGGVKRTTPFRTRTLALNYIRDYINKH